MQLLLPDPLSLEAALWLTGILLTYVFTWHCGYKASESDARKEGSNNARIRKLAINDARRAEHPHTSQ